MVCDPLWRWIAPEMAAQSGVVHRALRAYVRDSRRLSSTTVRLVLHITTIGVDGWPSLMVNILLAATMNFGSEGGIDRKR